MLETSNKGNMLLHFLKSKSLFVLEGEINVNKQSADSLSPILKAFKRLENENLAQKL